MDAIALASTIGISIAIGVPILVAFLLVLTVMSEMSGWRSLAARYPGSVLPGGTAHRMQGGTVGGISYRNSLTLSTTPEGLNVAMTPILSFRHKPVFIPWDTMRNLRITRGFASARVSFDIGDPAVGRMTLPAKVMAARPA